MNNPHVQLQASEILRTIIDRIEVGPDTAVSASSADKGDPKGAPSESPKANMKIVLYGQLAAVMALAEEGGIDKKGRFSCVAGTGNQRYLQLAQAWL